LRSAFRGADVPSEAVPLVIAVNQALDRWSKVLSSSAASPPMQRMSCKRRQPSSPPASTLEGNGQVSALREEMARMNRLVEHLLYLARLDSVALDVSSPVSLRRLVARR
jgi:hypothetical protein